MQMEASTNVPRSLSETPSGWHASSLPVWLACQASANNCGLSHAVVPAGASAQHGSAQHDLLMRKDKLNLAAVSPTCDSAWCYQHANFLQTLTCNAGGPLACSHRKSGLTASSKHTLHLRKCQAYDSVLDAAMDTAVSVASVQRSRSAAACTWTAGICLWLSSSAAA